MMAIWINSSATKKTGSTTIFVSGREDVTWYKSIPLALHKDWWHWLTTCTCDWCCVPWWSSCGPDAESWYTLQDYEYSVFELYSKSQFEKWAVLIWFLHPRQSERHQLTEERERNRIGIDALERLPVCWWEQNRIVWIPLPTSQWMMENKSTQLTEDGALRSCPVWTSLYYFLTREQTHACFRRYSEVLEEGEYSYRKHYCPDPGHIY